MLSLLDVKKKTDDVFGENLTLPVPSLSWQRKLEALNEANLGQQRSAAIFDMRCEQAKLMGFEQIETAAMVEMLMGKPHTYTKENKKRQDYEYVYNHHIDELESNQGWGGNPVDFIRKEPSKIWYLPPFSSKKIWRCRFGKLDYLKRTIPYGVVLRINEVKTLKLFNVFNVMAPIEAWERKTDIDPIVVATIWEIIKKDGQSDSGQAAHFFLAQW